MGYGPWGGTESDMAGVPEHSGWLLGNLRPLLSGASVWYRGHSDDVTG